MVIAVLRLSHRLIRDKRMSTHLALTARAFGATEFYYSGDHDSHVETSINNVTNEWGGELRLLHVKNPLKFIMSWKEHGIVVHLTMYGIDIDDKLNELQKYKGKDLLVIVGGAKVPGSIFQLADFNIAIGNQPHSEVAALAVFLDKYTEGRGRKTEFKNAKVKIIPSERGKTVVNNEIRNNEVCPEC
ncbi:MAG: tRNA (cytidine(56)-2'-O)-methyltransferase [Candidatus Heimdallarchaeaceae archaeon]